MALLRREQPAHCRSEAERVQVEVEEEEQQAWRKSSWSCPPLEIKGGGYVNGIIHDQFFKLKDIYTANMVSFNNFKINMQLINWLFVYSLSFYLKILKALLSYQLSFQLTLRMISRDLNWNI